MLALTSSTLTPLELAVIIALIILGGVLYCRSYTETYNGLPLIGVFHIFLFKSRQEYLRWFLDATKYKQIRSWKYWAPGLGWNWFTTDPAVIKTVLLTKNAHFSKADYFASVTKDLFGTGILLSTGESWKAQRAAGQLFGKAETLVKLADDNLPRNLKRAFTDFDRAADTKQVVDFERVIADLTLAVFGELAFDTDAERLMRTLPGPFDESMALLSRRMTQPLWPITERFTRSGKSGRRAIRAVNEFARQLVRDTLSEIEAEEQGAKDGKGRGALIRELQQGGVEFSEKDLAESCINFLIAGRDTTSNAMTWTLYSLLNDPLTLRRVEAEIAALPPGTHGMDYAHHLPLLDACISESLRLYPPVPTELVDCTSPEPVLVGRSLTRSFASTSAMGAPDMIVKPGESVVWCPWVMARLPELWGRGAEKWRPERWLNMASKPSAFQHPVFHAGRRSCVGQAMARLELVMGLKALLERYRFSAAYLGERVYDDGMTGAMRGGLPVRVTRRSPKQGLVS